MVDIFSVLFMYWIIYSLLGWVVETIYCSVIDGYFVGRGFLNGPLCPIYGFGELFLLLLLNQYSDNIAIVLILSMIYTTIIEYITSFIMEKLFKMRWWDYSEHKFNIGGRVCLKNSFLF
ncbi:putative ABC transporter permease [Clostridium sp.]|uniref:putative ABC transporter permease n=1 Tax=Clostridium sp. TaxID=1506 RepID=UPI003217FA76